MLNKLLAFSRKYGIIFQGDSIVCALSGGADSVALTFALYLLRDKLGIQLAAAHFNHHLRGAESDRDEAFVRDFCARYDIPLYLGSGNVVAGEKGLEAAAREARYAFLRSLPGKIATAHTADDNAETLLLHLVRGTGLKGLGGISPVARNVIRPMLTVTRQEVAGFLAEWNLPHMEDSSNQTDLFLRNRLRHHVMPLLQEENPRLAENLTQMALNLRQDSDYLEECAASLPMDISALRQAHPAVRARALEGFLKSSGVREPEREHIGLAEKLVFSHNPSASGNFPGNVTIARCYHTLTVLPGANSFPSCPLPCPGTVEISGYRITCRKADTIVNTRDTFTLHAVGDIRIRSRQAGDSLRLPGGTRLLKKLFIDRKIPAHFRDAVPVVADDAGILCVAGLGADQDRVAGALPAVQVHIEFLSK